MFASQCVRSLTPVSPDEHELCVMGWFKLVENLKCTWVIDRIITELSAVN
jgi:hypothetical protein